MAGQSYIDNSTERHLIAAAQSGDVTARNKLILACLPHVHRTVAFLAPRAAPEEVEDICHEAVLALYAALDAYDLQHPKRPRLYVFAASRIRKAVARHYREASTLVQISELPDQPDAHQAVPESALETQQTVSRVRHALSGLTGLESHVLYSRRALDPAPTRAALARQFGVSQQWIERVEHRAATKLSALLGMPSNAQVPS